MHEIEKLPELLASYLEESLKFIEYKATNLTKPGENYGSVILNVEIKLKDLKTNNEETIYAVAKAPHKTEELQEFFKSFTSFINEAEFYKTVIPTLQTFQKREGIEDVANYAPKFIAVRRNLNTDDPKVDDTAVLLLENVSRLNYVMVNRVEGFNLECTELILKKIANLHATAIGVKLKTPEDFEKKIKPYLDGVIFDGKEEEELQQHVINMAEEILLNNPNFRHLAKRTVNALENLKTHEAREPFATVVHEDMWVNNIMLKFEEGKPVDVMFIDFQICRYASLAVDLLFFLFTSVQDCIVDEKLDYLIKFYFENFIETVKKLNCDATLFTYKEFLKEIDLTAKESKFMHCVLMLFPIMRAVESEEEVNIQLKDIIPSTRHKEKLCFIVNQFAQRNWI